MSLKSLNTLHWPGTKIPKMLIFRKCIKIVPTEKRNPVNTQDHNPMQCWVYYMLPEDYDWATADWLGPEAGSPACALRRQQKQVHPQEYNYQVVWQAGTSAPSEPKHPDNIVRRSRAYRTPSASWARPKRRQRLDRLTNASIHALQQNAAGTPAS